MANPISVTEEFLRYLATHCVPSVHAEGTHGLIDALPGALGRKELERREAERIRKDIAARTGRDPDMVGDAPPGWRKNADGTWERAEAVTPAVAAEPAGPPGWHKDPETGAWTADEPAAVASP